ncbi:MAG: helix-turn-helix transcriptional regulator [Chloroflexi bacterium]|nr:helix-turn-helix transcriptional regulator [Chloroflexota bacterium]
MAEILNEWTYRRARTSLRAADPSIGAAELAASLAGYQALRTGGGMSLEIRAPEDLGRALVQARVARGWTQAQLAQALGMAKQQIQRYEATEYGAASLHRIARVAEALGLRLSGTAASYHLPAQRSDLARWRAGLAAGQVVQAAEKRQRLSRLTAAEARRIYDDLCETHDRLAPHQPAAGGVAGIAPRLAVRQAMAALARRKGRRR